MKDLFLGLGVAHTILLLAFVIGIGIYLSRFKVKGVSIGSTWILITGIVVSHFGLRADPELISFVKEFGLILFVFSIGFQVGSQASARWLLPMFPQTRAPKHRQKLFVLLSPTPSSISCCGDCGCNRVARNIR